MNGHSAPLDQYMHLDFIAIYIIKKLLRWCGMHFMIVGQFTGLINLDKRLLGAHVALFLSLVILSYLC